MSKRVPPGEKPFSPVDAALVRGVLNPVQPPAPSASPGAQPVIQPPVQNILPTNEAKNKPSASGEVSRVLRTEKLNREKTFLLTSSEEWELERLVGDMAGRLRTPLKASHVLRAAVILLQHAGDDLVKQCERIGTIKRPANGDIVALTAFDHYLAEVLHSALRNARPFR
jgi:hypothetical protein